MQDKRKMAKKREEKSIHMKKILIVACYSRFVVQFELNNAHILQNMGYEVHYACNYEQEDMYSLARQILEDNNIVLHQIDFVRSPYKLIDNTKAYNQLKALMTRQHFDGVHCHTPMAGLLARMAAKATNTKPVIYTAHGFHFYKGCPLKNKLIYETAERYMAKYTDALITINKEDFEAAQNFKLRGKAYYIPGVGVDVNAISNLQVDRTSKRQELGIATEDFVVISVGELNSNKNQKIIVQALANIDLETIHYIICGKGSYESKLKEQVTALHLESKVHFVGFREDAKELLKISDAFVFPSFREGLSVAIMEAMAAGLPCIVSNIRGNVDLIDEGKGGYLCDPQSSDDFANVIKKLESNRQSGIKMGQYNMEKIKLFDVSKVTALMEKIYSEQVNR
ncbi:MAG: glycosyltransferase family 4 protein [Oscillospiraceae bacterium]